MGGFRGESAAKANADFALERILQEGLDRAFIY
jgi:hypothetical protein